MTDKTLVQADLELIDDKPEGAEPEAAAAEAKPADEPKSAGLFDGLDDDDGEEKGKTAAEGPGDAKDKPEEGAEDKGKSEDKDGEGKKDAATEDAGWRERATDKILAPLKDKLSQAKFEKRREQLLTQFKRYKTADDAVIAGVMAQEKLRSGEHRKLADGASPEEAAAWRKENDIPEDPAKYDIPAIPGHTWKEVDTPTLDSFKAAAHEANLPQSAVNRLTKWWVEQQQNSEAEYDSRLKALDREDKEACHDAIRTEFGVAEFKPSMKVMQRLLEDEEVFGGEASAKIMSARFYDEESGMWRRLTSLPEIARGLIALATERYGDGAMASGDGRPSVSANRLDEIDKIMNADYDRYVREGLADEAMAIRRKQQEKVDRRASRGMR
jgi:hypothetical protein